MQKSFSVTIMLNNNKLSIAEDDRKVLDLLIKDSRQSPNEIAEKIGFSRQKVWRIINRLEKNKIIWGYTTVINHNIIGYNFYFALCKAKVPTFDIVDKLIKTIKENKAEKLNVRFLGQFYLNGTYDWIIIFLANDIGDAKKFCGYIQKEYGNCIDRIDLLESVFTLIRYGKINPDIEKLKEFAVF
jgi:DNA-binding Lrp family transcriptional regulator